MKRACSAAAAASLCRDDSGRIRGAGHTRSHALTGRAAPAEAVRLTARKERLLRCSMRLKPSRFRLPGLAPEA
ncbi:hypothetical protein PACILC2_07470 [Paenibacillus cisolokensis]|uniref:Uncharacterized protein n=1 Tax=Paenibacillus cisolokensis TaxID=1658519 RepID=A0ABQ4N1X7_9BACL|nr:hypothetical protein [Paenibacillus cisolokensis]GIQ62179.1 hypothetical protein PACILC2_07470 [Paenibacillus cisolokensis]